MLGPEHFGIFSIFFAATMLVWHIPIAFDAVFVSYAKQFDTKGGKNELLKAPIAIKIYYFFVIAIIAYPLSYFLAKYCFQKQQVLLPLIAAMLCGIFITFLTTVASTFQEEERFGKYASMHAFFTGFVLVSLIFLKIIRDEPSLQAVIIAYIVVSIIIGSVSFALLIFQLGSISNVDKALLKTTFHWGKWIIGSQMAYHLFYRLDIFFLTRYVDFKDIGVYSVAAQLNYVIGLATGALAGICLPKAGRAVRSKEAFQYYFKESIFIIVMIEVGIGIYMIIAPIAVTYLYGNQYAAAAGILKILLWGCVFNAMFVPFSFLFIALGDTRTRFMLELTRLIIGAGIMLWTVPRFGLMGAAYTMTATLLIDAIVSIAVLRYRLGTTYKDLCLVNP
jgi:O-antigen/teichoic acid export membrane protein